MYNTHLQNTFVGWDMLATKAVWSVWLIVYYTPNSTYYSDSGGSWASMSVASAVCYKALFLFPEQQSKERHVTVQSLQKVTQQNPLTHPRRELMFGSLIHISIAAVFLVHELPQVMLLR